MKADESRTPLPVKHQLDHELPTVLHQPDADQPLLARWVERAMENQTRFWGLIAALVVVLVGLSVLGSGLSLGRASSDEAWTRLETAKTPAERVEIAREFPKTPAQRWALLQAATEYHNQGFNDLPANREAALPTLKKALDLFDQVANEAPHDSPQARVAALGLARTLEARNDLAKAMKQYQKVAATRAWAGTEEARTAERLARSLGSPEAARFYKDLYAFKAAEATLPPGGLGNFQFPLPAGHPPIGGPRITPLPGGLGKIPEPNLSDLPPPPPSPEPRGAEAPAPASSGGLPADVFTPPPPRAEPNAARTPKAGAVESPAPPSGLPSDVFSPDAVETPDASK